MNNKQLGSQGESFVCVHLRKMGYEIIQTNYASRYGEVDIIAQEGDEICFIEVKTRSGASYGDPLEAITAAKRHKLIRMAQWYLAQKNLENVNARFDVAGVFSNSFGEPTLEIIKNAFELDCER